jgi:NTP pyrophosphatase (non-canonical NTP hydrolase)
MTLDHDRLLRFLIRIEGDSITRTRHCMEEAAELVVALSHYKRGRPRGRDEVIEELGDLLFTARGVIMALGIEKDVEAAISGKAWKLAREFGYECPEG